MVTRALPLASLAAGITFSLFWAMTILIRVPDVIRHPEPLPSVDWVDVRLDTPVPQVRPTPERPEPLEAPPLPPVGDPLDAGPGGVAYRAPTDGFEATVEGTLTLAGPPDGEAVPMVRVRPTYPAGALRRGTEGRVLVEFSVDPLGRVRDARVVVAEPAGVFEDAALEAVRQWRYNPRVVNGEAVPREGLRVAIPFVMGASR